MHQVSTNNSELLLAIQILQGLLAASVTMRVETYTEVELHLQRILGGMIGTGCFFAECSGDADVLEKSTLTFSLAMLEPWTFYDLELMTNLPKQS